MENDLISRAALLGVPNVRKVCEYDETGCSITYKAVPVEVIEKVPAVEAEPVRHGRWIRVDTFKSWECSECGALERHNCFDYCHCGAKMDAKEDDNG